jgi:ATP-dependent helicase HrpB
VEKSHFELLSQPFKPTARGKTVTPLGLPVEAILDSLKQQLSERHEVVLEAPPGAGKTTLIPLALMDEPWLKHRKILMLEPRRIATRSAAYRMASLLNESPGQTIGYRMRLETKVSKQSKVEVITEGILTRMLQQDPSLDEVGLVIFDEFHERSLDSDLALSLCLKGRALFRAGHDQNQDPLKILVMSATLDSYATSTLLGGAPVVKSEGRAYPVDIIYGQASKPKERISDRMAATIKQAITENPNSSVLAFLPGQGEIRGVADALSNWIFNGKFQGIHLHPLYGNLSIEEQQQAIGPLSGQQANDQKIVLATNIAETSLTIDGVDVVVDCGLVREAKFNPSIGMSGLHTVKISRASSVQRAGRAGRLRPGKCYRLWSAEQQLQLAAHGTAEILNADLAPLALQLLQWGVDDPRQLSWIDPPPKGLWQQAMDLLRSLGAIRRETNGWLLTDHGKAMTSLPVHPRLAHLLLCGSAVGFIKPAALLASLLSDRDPFSRDNADISTRLEILSGKSPCPPIYKGWLQRTRQLAQQFEQQATKLKRPSKVSHLLSADQLPGYLLACAYPERIARQRHSGGYQLANGRSAKLMGHHHLANSDWLAIAEVSSMQGGKGDIIRSAVQLDEALFDSALSSAIELETIAEWDTQTNRFVAEQQQKIGVLILQRTRLNTVPAEAKSAALIQHIRKQGLCLLPWTAEIAQWCARVRLVRSIEVGNNWPDVSDEGLLATLEDWLAPYLNTVNLLNDFKKVKLTDSLHALLPWDKQQALNKLAPTHLKVPSGSNISIDYTESPPVLAVKLQEMFGCEQSPAVIAGKVPLLIHLLSPAGKPLQITQDLMGFWRSSYHEVKKEMKGRYPKHPWPDNPLVEVATRKTKKRS